MKTGGHRIRQIAFVRVYLIPICGCWLVFSVCLCVCLANCLWAGPASLNPTTRPVGGNQKVDALDAYFESGPLPRLRIEVDPVDLRGLDADPKTYIRARVRETSPEEQERSEEHTSELQSQSNLVCRLLL